MAARKTEVLVDRITGGPITRSGGHGVSYSLSRESDPGFDAHVARVLDEITVNGQVTLREYIALIQKGDSDALTKVRAHAGDSKRSLRDMTFWYEGTNVYQFWRNGDTYSGDATEELMRALEEKGERHESSPARHPNMRDREPTPERPE